MPDKQPEDLLEPGAVEVACPVLRGSGPAMGCSYPTTLRASRLSGRRAVCRNLSGWSLLQPEIWPHSAHRGAWRHDRSVRFCPRGGGYRWQATRAIRPAMRRAAMRRSTGHPNRSARCMTHPVRDRGILPNLLTPLIVQSSLRLSTMVLTAAGLSFIGLGVQPPNPELGTMMSEARGGVEGGAHGCRGGGAAAGGGDMHAGGAGAHRTVQRGAGAAAGVESTDGEASARVVHLRARACGTSGQQRSGAGAAACRDEPEDQRETRSAVGSATKMVLISQFGTWRRKGINPFRACRTLLLSP